MTDDPTKFLRDRDELLRAFILERYTWNQEFKCGAQIRELDALFQWVRHGRVPEKKSKTTTH